MYIKIAVTLTTILLVMSVILGLLYSIYADSFFKETKSADMEKAVDAISYLMVKYLKSEELEGASGKDAAPDSDYYLIRSRMATCHELLDVDVYISDRNGNIQMSFPLLPNENDYIITDTVYFPDGFENHFIHNEMTDKYTFINSDQYTLCFKNDNYVVDYGDFYGFYGKDEPRHLTICKRIISRQEKNAEVYGSVIMSCKIEDVSDANKNLIYTFIIFDAATILVVITLVLIIMRRLIRPLQELTKGASEMATGNFKIRVKKVTRDEVGELVDAFNHAAESLDNLDTVRNDFIANVSHELRTPMTSIRGFIEAILDGVIPQDQVNNYLEKVKRETIRLSGLVAELLDWARLAAGQTEIEMNKINVNAIAATVVSNLETIISDKNINIVVDIDGSDGKAVGDEPAIERVFINLIQNAIKFTPEGGTISISIKDIPELNKVSITISDTGIGMTPDEMKFIFERFYKADKSRTGSTNGTGLGLPIVSQILKNHNETIDVESEKGKGTSFSFMLSKEIQNEED